MHLNLLFLFSVFIALAYAPIAYADGTLGITAVSAEKTYAQADNNFAHGWKWVFALTVPTDEPVLQMKFGNWTKVNSAISPVGNVRFYSAQSSNSTSAGGAIGVNAVDTYGSVMNLLPITNPTFDLSTSTPGRQIQITVEVQIPTGSAGGSYTGSFGISTAPDTTSPVISLLGSPSVIHERGTAYTDAGATAMDNIDGSVTAGIVLSGTTINSSTSIGSYILSYNVSDAAGNAALTVTRSVTVQDTIAPTATVSYSTTTPTNADVVATLEPSEPVTVTNNGGATTTTFSQNGNFIFLFADVANNTGSTTASVANIDKVAPTIANSTLNGVDSNVAVNVASTSVAIALTASESVNWLSLKVEKQGDESVYKLFQSGIGCEDGTTLCSKTWTGDLSAGTLSDGAYRVKVRMRDAVGNETEGYLGTTITVDTTAPVITVTGVTSASVNIGSSYTDAGATALDARDGAVSVSSSGSVDTGTIAAYIISYTATDALGNTATASRTVNVVPILVTSITVSGAGSATSISLGNTLQMFASVLPVNATNSAVVWIVQCDNVANNCPGGQFALNLDGGGTISASGLLTPVDSGNMRVRATATDGSGISGTLDITIVN